MAFNLTSSKGVLVFQFEIAKIFYRNIEIKKFDETIPADNFLNN